ncbi:hypothetical protein [Serratia fonticola]|uniref:hypothetical protein n=1 Tax=Serratia fonticola TaxID=47917 RepID=UPI002178E527|nr:hypothetical protein [Serratia fonticola]CAI1546683.1 Uncharacterised protein [Serratia fonticola]
MNNRVIKKSGQRKFNNKLVLLFGLLFNSLYLPATNAATELRQGLNPLGTTTVNIVGSSGSETAKTNWDGLAFAIGKSQASSQCSSANQALTQTTIDGYSGVQIAPGVLFVIYDGSLSGQRGSSAGTLSYNYAWGAKGVLAPATGTEATWCADPRVNVTNGRSVTLATPNGGTTGSFKTGIYVSSGITNATVTVPQLYVTRGYAATSAQLGTAVFGSGLSYTIASDCTVSTPTHVAFGNVDVGSTSSVIASDGGVGVSCEGALTKVSLSYNAQALSPIPTTTTLAMTNNQGTTLGTVRGFIGTNAESQVGCTDASTSMRFNNTSVSLLNNASNNTAHTIPLKWVLCPLSTATAGEGNASATLNIVWN